MAAALICLSTAGQAAAQPLDAAAIDALHRKVLEEVHAGGASADVEAAAALARLYVEGAGVERDRVVGCSWAELARAEAAVQQKDPGDGRFERLQAWACDSLSPEERQLAMEMIACPRYGPDPQSFILDADRIADVSRRGVVIRRAAGERVEMLPVFGCPSRVALVRHTALERPDDRFLRTRHFLEVFAWTAGSADRESKPMLRWILAEIESDPLGDVEFGDLPDGRYDLVASAEGLVSSFSQAFDLAGTDVRRIEMFLKPSGPTQGLTIACGPGVGRTLAAIGEGADLVLHVEAVGERTREDESDAHLRLVTETRLRVLRTLKGHALGPVSGGASDDRSARRPPRSRRLHRGVLVRPVRNASCRRRIRTLPDHRRSRAAAYPRRRGRRLQDPQRACHVCGQRPGRARMEGAIGGRLLPDARTADTVIRRA